MPSAIIPNRHDSRWHNPHIISGRGWMTSTERLGIFLMPSLASSTLLFENLSVCYISFEADLSSQLDRLAIPGPPTTKHILDMMYALSSSLLGVISWWMIWSLWNFKFSSSTLPLCFTLTVNAILILRYSPWNLLPGSYLPTPNISVMNILVPQIWFANNLKYTAA